MIHLQPANTPKKFPFTVIIKLCNLQRGWRRQRRWNEAAACVQWRGRPALVRQRHTDTVNNEKISGRPSVRPFAVVSSGIYICTTVTMDWERARVDRIDRRHSLSSAGRPAAAGQGLPSFPSFQVSTLGPVPIRRRHANFT